MSGVFEGVNYHVLPETYRRMGDNGKNLVSLLKSEAGKECALDDSNLTVVICDSVDYRSNSTKPCESAFCTFVIPKWVFISHSMHYSLSLV